MPGTTGKVVADGSTPMLSRELDNIKPKEGFKSNLILHFLIPALIVIAVTIGTYVIMGSAQDTGSFRAGRRLSGHRAADPEGLQHP